MNDIEMNMAAKCVAALESIAASLDVLASLAAANGLPTAPVGDEPVKRGRGRPRKDAAPVAPAIEPAAAAPAAPPAPTEDERKEGFAKLRKALQDCLALHGEDVTRERLKFAKFSDVPFDAIPDTIARLAV